MIAKLFKYYLNQDGDELDDLNDYLAENASNIIKTAEFATNDRLIVIVYTAEN